jgi:hypothetical protein
MGDANAPRPRRFGAYVARGSALALGASLAVGLVSACGSKAVGVDLCKQIDTARCQRAPACGVMLTTPDFTSGTAVDACIRYYDVACLNGLEVAAPSSAEANACVDAINSDCDYVATPQNYPACSWLSTSPDAGEDANVPDVADASGAADVVASDVTTDAENGAD